MAAESSAGATPSVPRDWHSTDWKKAHVNVRRLQARIVQAMKAGKWGKVQALQHLLTRSFSAKALAVKRVTENQGKNTPGVDKVIWQTPTTKEMAIQELRQRGYTALPLRRLYIPKANGKKRPLGIPMGHAYCISLQRRLGIAVVAPTSMNAIDQLTQYNELGVADQVSSGKNRSESVRITSNCSGLLTSTDF
jgi:RNA-directed DNA polymerase